MSENTPTPEELVEEISLTVEDASVIPVPIDPTLSNEGEAADAAATGKAIAGVLDSLKVNEKTATASGAYKVITVYGTDILVSDATGAQTITQALEASASSTASSIMYDSENLISVADALDDIYEDMDTELSEEEIDAIIEEVFTEESDE